VCREAWSANVVVDPPEILMHLPFRHSEDPIEAALAISWLTVAWSTATGLASAAVGLRSHNLSLAGLGVTVLIDVASSLVLIWRFRHERSGGSGERPERIAHRVASLALVGFAAVLAAQAIRHLIDQARPDSSLAGVVLAATGLAVLPFLARRKYRVADTVSSAALRADAHITAVGAATAGVTLAGLAARALVGWWWADAVAALVLAAIAGRQGLGGLRR
jgi:divalent metal cation (Fe/Co/Zn/Cd) transporter